MLDLLTHLSAASHPHCRLAGRHHHLSASARKVVTVYVDVVKVVVEPDHLELFVGVEQRARIPQADVAERTRVSLHGPGFERRLGGKRPRLDLVEAVRAPGELDVVLQIGMLEAKLVGAHAQALIEVRHDRGEE